MTVNCIVAKTLRKGNLISSQTYLQADVAFPKIQAVIFWYKKGTFLFLQQQKALIFIENNKA